MYNYHDATVETKSWTVPLERIGSSFAVNNKTIELTRSVDILQEMTIFHIRALIPTLTAKECVSFPSDWRQAFKQRWFPEWAKRRWPVRFTTLDAKAFFPDAVVPKSEKLGSPAFSFTETLRHKS